MIPGIFIAGTDTDVGKTMFSAALVAALRARGWDAGYVKAVSSDGQDMGGRLVSPDAVWVANLAGLDDPWPDLNPVCVPHPLSPLAAIRKEGIDLKWEDLRAQVLAVKPKHGFLIWEGVGGVLVPICEGRTSLDLMAELGLPVLVVGRPLLGAINHTLLTIEAVRRRGLSLAGFAFSGPGPGDADDPAIEQNAGIIAEFSRAPFLGSLPWAEDVRAGVLAALVEEHLDLGPVLELG